MPAPAEAPTTSLCTALSSGDVVKVIVICGLSKPCAGVVAPAQTGRDLAELFEGGFEVFDDLFGKNVGIGDGSRIPP